MSIIYYYDAATGCQYTEGFADSNPLEPCSPLFPAYTTPSVPPVTAAFECARYLDETGLIPAHYSDGAWVVQPDWRNVPLWSTEDGSPLAITDPNITPDQIHATDIPYPGPGYIWHDEQWKADPTLQHQIAEQRAELELALRLAEATSEISRIKPAVDGGYAKPEDIELLPQWQRYNYELPDVREKPGWPEQPQWLDKPGAVV